MNKPFRLLTYLWTLPNSAIGLLFVPMSLGKVHWVDGVLEIHGGLAQWCLTHLVPLPGGASAITFGHVVLGRSQWLLEQTRTHERVHVRQYEKWGPLFIPAYLLASLVIRLRGGNAYLGNPFEKEAYDKG